jgi:putative ABC transport system permease protein
MIRNYLKVAWKVLLRRKFFTFISLFGISITLVVLMVATAMLDHLLSPHAPEVLGRRTLGIYLMAMTGEHSTRSGFAGYKFLDQYIRPMAELPGVESVAVVSMPSTVISFLNGRRIESDFKRTDGEFWRVLRFEFLEGAPFTADDDRNARFVAVINETTRQKFFGGATAVGKTIEADGQRFRVVGVVKDVPSLRLVPYADIWVPFGTSPSPAYKQDLVGHNMGLIVARSRADFPQIKAEVAARLKEAAGRDLPGTEFENLLGGADTPFEALSRLLLSQKASESRPERLLAILLTVALVFMLLPTVNLVNLNLSRILDRASEIGVRKAFGASSSTLVGQFVVENVVLTLVGALLGLAVSGAVLHAINVSGLIPYAQLSLNVRVFLAGLGLALFFGLLSGVYPAWRMSRLHPVKALRGRSQ